MVKRVAISLEDIADRDNLLIALHKAAQGKKHREQVQAFFQHVDANLNGLSDDIRHGRMPHGQMRAFYVFDPKKRLIHAASFVDRVFHHALMNLAGPVLDRAMIANSFACRTGKGVHKAADEVQRAIRSFAWYGKIDIAAYFASIDHTIMLQLLCRRFKGVEIQAQFERMLQSYARQQGKGLPIGALTSQYFANYYLDGFDRLMLSLPQVRNYVRYMDDMIWWCDSREQIKEVLQLAHDYLQQQCQLAVKSNIQIQPSRQGVSYCGFRILPGVIRLSKRRKQRYQQRRLFWEKQYREQKIDALQLQSAYDAVHAITHGTDSSAWRKINLNLHPPITV